jgi:sorbitol-specific phosphotransferase system component IIC
MLDLLLSIVVLIYYSMATTKIDNCYYSALTYNILHILCHMLILIPLLIKLIKQKSLNKIKKEYIKSIVISHYRMPIFCWAMLGISLVNLYSIII